MADKATPVEADPDIQLVDLQVPTWVLNAAKIRVELVRERERRRTGVADTTLASVVRAGLLNWRKPPGPPPPRRRLVSHQEIRDWAARALGQEITGTPSMEIRQAYREANGLTTKAFRFAMPPKPYERAKARMHKARWPVARVVTDILGDFARTGTTQP